MNSPSQISAVHQTLHSFTLRKKYILKYWSLGCKQTFVVQLKAEFKLRFSLNYVKVAKSFVFCCFSPQTTVFMYQQHKWQMYRNIHKLEKQIKSWVLLSKNWSVKCEAMLQSCEFSRIMKPTHRQMSTNTVTKVNAGKQKQNLGRKCKASDFPLSLEVSAQVLSQRCQGSCTNGPVSHTSTWQCS